LVGEGDGDMVDLKFCKDCKSYVYAHDYYWDKDQHNCTRLKTENQRIDLVTGEISYVDESLNCISERALGGDCGPEGKYWEVKKLTYYAHKCDAPERSTDVGKIVNTNVKCDNHDFDIALPRELFIDGSLIYPCPICKKKYLVE
jgi:hypothetical protein